MNRLFLLIPLFFANTFVVAQTNTVYQYDANGNVLSRKMSTPMMKSRAKAKSVINNDMSDGMIKDVTISQSIEGNTITISVVGNQNEKVDVFLYDAGSRLFKSATFNDTAYTFDISMFPTGVYLVEVKYSDKVHTKKILKNK